MRDGTGVEWLGVAYASSPLGYSNLNNLGCAMYAYHSVGCGNGGTLTW